MNELCMTISHLRRADHHSASVRLQRERLEMEWEKTEEEVVSEFLAFMESPTMRATFEEPESTPEERARQAREMFGLPPAAPEMKEAKVVKEEVPESRQLESGDPAQEPGEDDLSGVKSG